MNLRYLAYNILKTDYKKLEEYICRLRKETGGTRYEIYKDLLSCFFKYDTRFLDYFYFRFFEEGRDREKHTNVWDMHLFHRKYNTGNAMILRNKLLFRSTFKSYFNYPYYEVSGDQDVDGLIKWIESLKIEKLVGKEPLGTVGKGVVVLEIISENETLVIENIPVKVYLTNLIDKGFTLFETFIRQHEVLDRIYPYAINTVRIVTFVKDNKEVDFWGALLRIGYDKKVDNFDAGGLSAKIDLKSGLVVEPAIVKDPFDDNKYSSHPITQSNIVGVQIPYWNTILQFIREAAVELEDVRTVGWDIAVTETGPTLIEGNDNWDKTHFEVVSGIGLNNRIKKLLKSQ